MPFSAKLLTAFEKSKTRYDVLAHRVVYTAYDLAETLHLPHASIVKNLLIKTEKGLYVALLSAAHQLDIPKLLKALKAKKLSIVKEKDMVRLLKLGKRPLASFGSLHTLPVVLEKSLLKNKHLIVSGGSFTESLRVPVKDFLAFENPLVGIFGAAKKSAKKAKKLAKKKPVSKKQTKKQPAKKAPARKKKSVKK